METNKTPNKDLMNEALEHYEEASDAIHCYKSDIPKAIRQYYCPVEQELSLPGEEEIKEYIEIVFTRTYTPITKKESKALVANAIRWALSRLQPIEPESKAIDFDLCNCAGKLDFTFENHIIYCNKCRKRFLP